MYGYARVNAGICRGPAVLNTLELDLQVVVMLQVLGTKLGSLEEQQVLLVADSPLQFPFPPFQFFCCYNCEYVCIYAKGEGETRGETK